MHKIVYIMELVRIGDKLIDLNKVDELIARIIDLRAGGATQADVASRLGVERTFISHLEALGSIRRGSRVALVGFPIQNISEVEAAAKAHGVDFTFLLSEDGRQDLAGSGTGITMFNMILETVAKLREYETVIFLGSDRRIELVRKILNREVVGVMIGESPITRDVEIDIARLNRVLAAISSDAKGARQSGESGSRKRKSWILKKRSPRRSRASRAQV